MHKINENWKGITPLNLYLLYIVRNRTNPKKKCLHSENLNKVYLPYGHKIKFKEKEKPKVMNEKERNLVKNIVRRNLLY